MSSEETASGGVTPTGGQAPARVLLIEDDLPLATILSKHLKARGHQVRVSTSAEDATKSIRAGYRPTIVLLDINLPGDSGWSFLRAGVLDAVGKPPVFVVSATAVPPSRLREFDCAGYLPKPFAVSTLVEIVERHHSEADGADTSVSQGGFDAF
jgi:two-component system response regulator RegX3